MKTYKIYVQTEKGAALLREINIDGAPDIGMIRDEIQCSKYLVGDVVAPGEMYTIGCGTTIPNTGRRGALVGGKWSNRPKNLGGQGSNDHGPRQR